MAVPLKSEGTSWTAVLLLIGLSVLSWISTYTGLMELITASSGDPTVEAKFAVAFAVLMLQLMILYILNALFSGQLRWWLWPLYMCSYALLFLIAVGFAFGFYWKYLEAGNVSSNLAETSLAGVRETMTLGSTRLEQLQATLANLTAISAQKAEKERSIGGTCGVAGANNGDGPRRRLRDADAQRFQFASDVIGKRASEVKTDMAALNKALQELQQKTGGLGANSSRTAVISAISNNLSYTATRFNALRSDPQLHQLNDTFRQRAQQSQFPDDHGGSFTCRDPQLETALNGVIRAIDELPELRMPALRAYEGSEAVVEAFRRLSTSVCIAMAIPVINNDGLKERDIVPLSIAIFVDLCILLISVNRPFGRTIRALTAARKAQDSRLIELLLPVYRVFINNFDPVFHPKPEDVIAPLVDIVIDHKGKYYAVAPLDYRGCGSIQWIEARVERGRKQGELFPCETPRERSRYISSALVILQGQGFIRLIPHRRVLTDAVIRAKLSRQGSAYCEAENFRVYAFAPNAWEEFLHAIVGSGAKAEIAAQRHRNPQRTKIEEVVEILRPSAPQMPVEIGTPWVSRGNLNSVRNDGAARVTEISPHVECQKPLVLSAPLQEVEILEEYVDDDPSEEIFSGLKFNTLDKSCLPKRPVAPKRSVPVAQPSNVVSFPLRR